MKDIQEKKAEVTGLLDAIISVLEQIKSMESAHISVTAKSNEEKEEDFDAFSFLFDILKSIIGDPTEITDWLVNLLELAMPVMEASVKAQLLANIKSEVNCGSDPIIPNKLREFYYDAEYALYRNKNNHHALGLTWTDTKTMQIIKAVKGEGLQITLSDIDFLDKLAKTPTSKEGKNIYFDVNQKQSPFALCRPNDMDAFIWFAIHKAKFYSAYQSKGLVDLQDHFGMNGASEIYKMEDGTSYIPKLDSDEMGEYKKSTLFSLYEYFYVKSADEEGLKNVASGTALKYSGGTTIAICTKIKQYKKTVDGKTTYYTGYAQFLPCTDSYQGAMWYTDSYCYHGKDLIMHFSKGDAYKDEIYNDKSAPESDETIENEKEDEAINNNHPRNYEDEFPIFKLDYNQITSGNDTTKDGTSSQGSAKNEKSSALTFKILAKPFIMYPQMSNDKWQQVFVASKAVFDSFGAPSMKGHYSCYINPSYNTTYTRKSTDTSTNSKVIDASTVSTLKTTVTANCEQCYFNFSTGDMKDKDTKDVGDGYKHCWKYRTYNGTQFNDYAYASDVSKAHAQEGVGWLVVGPNGQYQLKMDGGHLPQECMYPCYAPSTIYQFNYQYVMGMQLFNAKAILAEAFDYTFGFSLKGSITGDAGLTVKLGETKQRIIEIIKNMCEVDSSSISDCFYSFSNDKYSSMLRNADLKRKKGYKFKGGDNKVYKTNADEINDILSEYDDSATLNERTNTLKRAITQASVSVTEGVDEDDEVYFDGSINFDFIKDLVTNLTIAMTYAILTPKVIMLFKVNKELMGEYDEYDSIEDFLKANEAIVISIVKIIRDLILEELTAFVMQKLSVIIALWSTEILREYYEKIKKIMKLLTEDWKKCIPEWLKQRTIDTEISIVNYADINNDQAPVTEHCD